MISKIPSIKKYFSKATKKRFNKFELIETQYRSVLRELKVQHGHYKKNQKVDHLRKGGQGMD